MKIFVNMDCFVVAEASKHPFLITNGVSTCICILLKGSIGGVEFIGMYHWSGFGLNLNKKASVAKVKAIERINDLIYTLSNTVRHEMEQYASSSTVPKLDAFYVIGGQRASEGEVCQSGTELEISVLTAAAEDICSDYFYTSSDTLFRFDNYQTSGTEAMSIVFSFNDIEIIRPGLGDDLDEYLVDDPEEREDIRNSLRR